MAHGAHMLEAERSQPRDARRMKGLGAVIGAGQGSHGTRGEWAQADKTSDWALVVSRQGAYFRFSGYWRDRCRLRRPLLGRHAKLLVSSFPMGGLAGPAAVAG